MDIFLVAFYLAGLVLATAQDIKRQEVDNWLNLLLLVGGISYLVFKSIALSQNILLFNLFFYLIFMFLLENIFYLGRVFAGGDAKLLIALTPLFITSSTLYTGIYLFIYIMLFLIGGSVYGLIYTFYLYIRNAKDINKQLNLKKIFFFSALSIVFFILSKLNFIFLIAGFVSLFPVIILFSISLEKVVMVREVPGNKLREGDWLAENLIVNNKKILATWDGLTKKDLAILKKVKKVKIKEGLPFVPAFLIGLILYIISKEWILQKISCVF